MIIFKNTTKKKTITSLQNLFQNYQFFLSGWVPSTHRQVWTIPVAFTTIHLFAMLCFWWQEGEKVAVRDAEWCMGQQLVVVQFWKFFKKKRKK